MSQRTGSVKKNYDITYKILVLGETSVGKTALIRKYFSPNEPFSTSLLSTVGIDFVNKIFVLDGIRIRLQIWDTAGQERFRTMTRMHFRGTKGILLVYDITNDVSFDRLQNWMKDIKEHQLNTEELILVGNKCDLTKERQIKSETGQELARQSGVKFFETSAKVGSNVTKVFEQLATDMKDANDPFVRVIHEDIEEDGDTIQPSKDEDDNGRGKHYHSRCCGV